MHEKDLLWAQTDSLGACPPIMQYLYVNLGPRVPHSASN